MCVIYSDSKATQDLWEPGLQNQAGGNAMVIGNLIRRSRLRVVTDFTLDLFHLPCRLQIDYGIKNIYMNLKFSSK